LRAPGALAGSGGGKHAEADDSAATALAGMSPEARAVHQHLAQRGACFLAEIVQQTGLEPAAIEDGLWELTAAGLAAADGFAGLRVLVDRQRGESRSIFDGRERRGPPRTSKWSQAVSKSRTRERYRPAQATRSLPAAAGRWSLLGQPDIDALDPDAHARQLLARYGVVFRDLLARESNLPPWRELARALRRMEARGEIRGGRFISGFVGEQFALPEAVEGLRAMRKTPVISELARIPATDPLNLVGVTSAGPKVPAVVGNAVLYRDGVPLASLEAGEVIMRTRLDDGSRVDEELGYHPPPQRERAKAQIHLPFAGTAHADGISH
jgi:ATP-dependent Lhr-like helicase